MEVLTEHDIGCPYCGEVITVLVDPTDLDDEYIEDCQVCCRPIVFSIVDGGLGAVGLSVRREDDTF